MTIKDLNYYEFIIKTHYLYTVTDIKYNLKYIILHKYNKYFSFIIPTLLYSVPKQSSVLLITLLKNKSILNTFKKIIHEYYYSNIYKYKLTLDIIGLGYKSIYLNSNYLIFLLGFSHYIKIKMPLSCGVEVSANGKCIAISSSEKDMLGNIIYILKHCKPTDVYKGKGIKQIYKEIKLKLGKTKVKK